MWLAGLVFTLLVALGLHALAADLDPVRVVIRLAIVGVAYHLVVALIRRYIWPRVAK